MGDADQVARVAAEFLARQGATVVAYLRDMAEIAGANGDPFSAEAWTDIADAVERRLRGG